jgi:hypothetical protein
MQNWNIIITFTYPHEAHLAKGKLESEGIEVIIKDELTAQVNNFYSNAIGGVKLFVKDTDFDAAYKILVDTGYILNKETTPNKFWIRFDKLTSKLPLIGKSVVEFRLIILIALIILILLIPIFLKSLPSTQDKLIRSVWCVESIYYKGKEIKLKSVDPKPEIDQKDCSINMAFRENGMAFMPGINSYDDIAHWEFRNDSLIISSLSNNNDITSTNKGLERLEEDTIRNTIYLRSYKLEIKNSTIKMQSDSLIIFGKSEQKQY